MTENEVPQKLELFSLAPFEKKKRQYRHNKIRRWKRKTFEYFDSHRLWGRRYRDIRKAINSLEREAGKNAVRLFFDIFDKYHEPDYSEINTDTMNFRIVKPFPNSYLALCYCFNKFFSRDIVEKEKELRKRLIQGYEDGKGFGYLQVGEDITETMWYDLLSPTFTDMLKDRTIKKEQQTTFLPPLILEMFEYIIQKKKRAIVKLYRDYAQNYDSSYSRTEYESLVDLTASKYKKDLVDFEHSTILGLESQLNKRMRKLDIPSNREVTFENDLEYFLFFSDYIFRIDHQTGIKFSEKLMDFIETVTICSEHMIKSIGAQDFQHFVREYANSVRFLLEKSKLPNARDYKPSELLAKILEPKMKDFKFLKSFQNPVFLNHLYEGRLPAYSWSASSGEEIMKALTTGDYRESYDAEKRLITKSVRELGEKYG